MQNFILAASLSVMVAVESTVIKYVKLNEKKDIPSEQLVFLVELVKLSISYIILLYTRHNDQGEDEENSDSDSEFAVLLPDKPQSSNITWFLFPAFLYAVSNNVTFAALALMSPALFNLLMNMKIPLTAFMAWMFLGYTVNRILILSFFTLSFGTAIATLRIRDGRIDLDGSIYGLILMFIYALCSAGGAVYTEYVTKQRFSAESMYAQNIKFCICSAFANAILIAIRGVVPYTHLRPLHILSVLALAANGLITAAVLKYGGSIIKTYAISVAMFISAFFTWMFFGHVLTWNFYFGAGICAVSVNLYAYEKFRH